MEDKKVIQFGGILDGAVMKKDQTLSLKIGTAEMHPNDMAQIFNLANRQIWVALAETALTKADLNIPEVVPEFKNDKTPSQRLRNTLYIYWKQIESTQDFDTYYRRYCEKQIEVIKDKLN